MKGRKEYPNKTKSKKKRSPASNVVSPVVLLHNVPIMKMTRDKKKRGKKEKKKNYRKAKGEAHIGKEWDSNCSSSDFDDEGLVASAFDKSSLFPNE